MSDVSINASNESPATTRVNSPAPISPHTAATALQLDINNPEAIMQITQGLIKTIRQQEGDYQAERTRATEWIRHLEGQAEQYLANQLTQEVSEGYVQNDNSKAPHFVIPIQDGYFQPAYWVKQLLNGNVAGYPKEYHPADAPYVGELYAGNHHGTNDDNNDTTADPAHDMRMSASGFKATGTGTLWPKSCASASSSTSASTPVLASITCKPNSQGSSKPKTQVGDDLSSTSSPGRSVISIPFQECQPHGLTKSGATGRTEGIRGRPDEDVYSKKERDFMGYAFCQFINPEMAHNGRKCTCWDY
jgi:hypothetical protein